MRDTCPVPRARATTTTSADELVAFEIAARDLVGLALRSVENLEVSLPQFRLLLVLHEQGSLELDAVRPGPGRGRLVGDPPG